MTTLSIVENKISSVKKYLKILERYKNISTKEIENHLEKRGAIERYLYLVAQATIDLAETVVAYKHLRKPTTMSESFYILNEEKIIPADLTEKMVKLTGFRNIMAHDYEKIDYAVVENVLKSGLKDIEKFIKIISAIFK